MASTVASHSSEADHGAEAGNASAQALAALAESVTAGARPDVLLDHTCALLVNVLPILAVSITLLDESGKPAAIGASDDDRRRICLRQFELDEGPCIDALQAGELVIEPDVQVNSGRRWPRWAPDQLKAKVGALYAAPIRIRDRIAAVLGMTWDEAGPPDEDEMELARQVAVVVTGYALALDEADTARTLVGQLEHALQTRIVIEQAKGVLAERLGIEVTEAYRLLRSHARSHRMRAQEVAVQVLNGELTFERER